jgi:predicted metal-dependent hydrolase
MAATDLVFTRHPRARRYVLRVGDDGIVRVTVPRWGSKKEAAAFAERERAWIEKQLRRNEERRTNREAPGTTGADPRTNAEDPRTNGEDLRTLREGRARAKRDLPLRVHELAARYGLTVARVSIRNQRSRWGSCSHTGHICLNWRLVDMPEAVRDYVIIHELMHLKRMDHSPRFWKLVEQACPDCQTARRWLRQHARGEATQHAIGKPPGTLKAEPSSTLPAKPTSTLEAKPPSTLPAKPMSTLEQLDLFKTCRSC